MRPTANIQAIHDALAPSFPNITGIVGGEACRNIENTNRWSQHAYRNATDYYGTADDLQRLYRWLTARRGILPITTVCYNRQGGCTTPHLDHLHVSATKLKGLPACAGGTEQGKSNGTVRRPNLLPADVRIGGVNPDPTGLEGFLRRLAEGVTPGLDVIPGVGTVRDAADAVTTVGESIGGFLGTLTDSETWVRVLLFVGGAAAIGIGLVALLAPPVAETLAAKPPPIGPIARAGQAIRKKG